MSQPATQNKSGMPAWVTPGRIGAAVVAVLAIVIVFQNRQEAVVNILWMTISMPLALLLALMFVLGWLSNELRDLMNKRKK